MATQLKSQGDFYTDFKNEVQSDAPNLTDFNPGSTNDIVAGVSSSGNRELSLLIVDRFKKCFFSTSDGPEVTQGTDDLQALALDRFGPLFARPGASFATTTITLSRPTFAGGAVTVGTNVIVKTAPNANGVAQRFQVVSAVAFGPTTLSVNASVKALVAGTDGDVQAGTIVLIETALTDNTIVVTNALQAAGGAAAQTDAQYRQTISNLIETLKGGTVPGIEALALTIAGVATATVIEVMQVVIGYNIGTGLTVGQFFRIPRTTLYIADVNGTASGALIAQVLTALFSLRACGVRIDVAAASPVIVNWTGALVLNPSGPNYGVFQNDTTLILDSMANYINTLPIGTGFVRANARAAILAIWGPSGTNDLVNFTNTVPVGDIAALANNKLKPGTMATA